MGIAGSVRKRLHAPQIEEPTVVKTFSLASAGGSVRDASMALSASLALSDGLRITSMLSDVFSQIDIDDNGCTELEHTDLFAFECLFSKLAMPASVEFKSIFTSALIKSMLEADIDASFRAMLFRRAFGNAWDLLPRVT